MATPITKRSEIEEIQRSAEAKHLLEHPMIQGALEAIEAEWEHEWKASNPADIKTREFAYRMLYSARKFKALLTKIIDSGNLAETAVDRKKIQEELLQGD